jgi:hypothetical protein
MMKKVALFTLAVLVFSVVFAQSGYAWHDRGGGRGDAGLYAAGALVGGLLLGTAIGVAVNHPRYIVPPAYASPASAPVYANPAAPSVYSQDGPPGEWVMVPGRWIDSRWVPAHKVWIPVNP